VALIDLGDAFEEISDTTQADQVRKRARTIARAERYHELEFRAEAAEASRGKAPQEPVPTRQQIVSTVESLFPSEVLAEGRFELAGV
jgi:hypothetical protein